MDVIALLPTIFRPEGLTRAIRTLRDTAPLVDIIVAAEWDDEEAHRIASSFGIQSMVCKEPHRGCSYAWNSALACVPDYGAYVLAADDVYFKAGWFERTMDALAKIGNSGMVGFKERPHLTREWAVHYLMTRDFIVEHHGGVAAIPYYDSDYVDLEAYYRAKKAGKYIMSEAMIVHDWKGPNGDETYRKAAKRKAANREIYNDRKVSGFPDDFEPILRPR